MVDLATSRAGNKRSSIALVSVFTLSIFLSATLLFSVQPLFAKLVLPLLGGSSSVWNTAMVFFQGTLLLGYIYAHLISKYLDLRLQIITHVGVLAVGLLFLPLAIASGWTPGEGGAHSLWLIGLFAVSVGLPFFAISANAPLLQRWFSRTDHKDADDPYFLYAASNAGSLLSLCLYPVVFEPMMRLRTQTDVWAQGYAILMAVIVMAGVFAVLNRKAEVAPVQTATKVAAQAISNKQRLFWIFLAFIPSSLMLGVTSHMANNIASAPFLWIIPLALFLLTFVIVFAKSPIVTPAKLSKLFPWVILVALIAGFVLKLFVLLSIALSLVCYFIIALYCHGRLAEARPEAARLTEFYIWMSVGGVLGGVFNALLAPVIFPNVYEYLLVLILAQFAVKSKNPQSSEVIKAKALTLAKFAVPAAIIFAVLNAFNVDMRLNAVLSGGLALFGLNRMRGQGKTFFIDFAILIALVAILPRFYHAPILTDRSFFGVMHVKEVPSEFGTVHSFVHGDTVHNYQFRDPELRKIPLAYYAPGNTFDMAVQAARVKTPDLTIAMVGLGAGAMACYEKPGDSWTYYEIDPAIVDMAKNPKYFSFMSDCSYENDVRIGDARMTLEALAPMSQDMIVIDAFSSDTIPTHLLTREAMDLYISRLKPDGVIFFHTSNRVMDVASVVVRLADDAGFESRYISRRNFDGKLYAEFQMPSTGVIMGPKDRIEAATAGISDWKAFQPSPSVKVWSDDYSSIIGALKSFAFDEYKISNP
ncbi:fused MFS/spermidine synthase [Fretibacter rubidus]|uniref:fused MFS/spermidine synthase n=1 Tax=Fretibacter rubidus TaxID=570162 RepID=UPI00352B367B